MRPPLVVLIGKTLLLDGISAYLEADGAVAVRRIEWDETLVRAHLGAHNPALIIMDSSIMAAAEVIPALIEATAWSLVCLDPAQNRGSVVRSRCLTGLTMAELCRFAIQAACCGDAIPLRSAVEVEIGDERLTLSQT